MLHEADWISTKGRLNDGEKGTPRIFPIVRQSDKRVSTDCLFCSDPFFQRNFVFWTGNFVRWTSKDYSYVPGDTMVVSYGHKDGYANMRQEEFAEVMDIVNYAQKAYNSIPEVKDLVVLQALGGRVAGQGIEDHFHFHLVPRFYPSVERQVCVVSPNNFIIRDASSWYLTRILLNKKSQPGWGLSESLPGALEIPANTKQSELLQSIQQLERDYYVSMRQSKDQLPNCSSVDKKITALAKITKCNISPRRSRIFKWMLDAFQGESLDMFGYNLFIMEDKVLFLPRSGLYGAKRIGAISILGNMHWMTESLGDNENPAIYRAPLRDYPTAHHNLEEQIFRQLNTMMHVPVIQQRNAA
jgi:diadenosine tetraphosphate (Ap4A) HIT family hydrolase